MTTPADTPVPRHLSEEERALWEKARWVQAQNAHEKIESPACYRVFEFKPDPAVILALLTALSTSREAGFCGATVTLGFGGTLRCGKSAGHPAYVSHYDADHLVTFTAPSTETPHA